MQMFRTRLAIVAAAALTAGMVAATQAQPAKDAPKKDPPPAKVDGGGRGMRREPVTKDEIALRIKQRREELKAIEQRLDEAQKMVETPGITDQQVAERVDAMRPSARWFLLRGFGGEGRESRDGEQGGGRPWGPKGGDVDWSKPATPEELDAGLAWVKEHMPRLGPRLEELKKSDAEAFARIMQRMRPRIAEMERLATENPESAKIRIAEWQAGMRVVDASNHLQDLKKSGGKETELAKARDDVHAALAEQFDAQLKMQEGEIGKLKERTDRAQKRIEELRGSRDEWLARRMEEIESGKERHHEGGRGDGGPSHEPPKK